MTNLKIEEFRKYLEIDQSNLDREVVEQSSLFEKIGTAHAEAIANRDYLKEQLAVTDAELATIVRKKIEKSGERATDQKVSAAILLEVKHRKAFDLLNEAKEQAEKLSALKEAFQMRSYMIGNLTNLFQANYFTRDSIKAKTTKEEVIYSHVKEKMAKNRKRLER